MILCFVSCIRATVEELLKEYKACESADYISYVSVFIKIEDCLLNPVLPP